MSLAKVWVAACDECFTQYDAVDGFGANGSTKGQAADQLRFEGWRVTARRILCPQCQDDTNL